MIREHESNEAVHKISKYLINIGDKVAQPLGLLPSFDLCTPQ